MPSSSRLTTALLLFGIILAIIALPICLPVSRSHKIEISDFWITDSEFREMKKEVEALRTEVDDLRNEIRNQSWLRMRASQESLPLKANESVISPVATSRPSDFEISAKRQNRDVLQAEYNQLFEYSLAEQIRIRGESRDQGLSREDITREVAKIATSYGDRLAALHEQISLLSKETGELRD